MVIEERRPLSVVSCGLVHDSLSEPHFARVGTQNKPAVGASFQFRVSSF
jgi:hypothetical protein